MKRRLNLEACIYATIVLLSLIALALTLAAVEQFRDVKVVYQGF